MMILHTLLCDGKNKYTMYTHVPSLNNVEDHIKVDQLFIGLNLCMYVVHVCIYVYAYVYAYVYIHTIYVYICTHTYICIS